VAGSFRVGLWRVEPGLNTISRNGITLHLESKVMEVLVCLARHAGEPISKETLLQTVWSGTFVSDDVLFRSISELRRVLEDDARQPTVIQTIPKRGYRLVAPVEWIDGAPEPAAQPSPETDRAAVANTRLWMKTLAAIVAALLLVVLIANVGKRRWWLTDEGSAPAIHSLAVLPLQNLSNDAAQEYFSDGMTDALITDLAQIGSIKVISRTSSMQYKQTNKSLPEIARELGVDGIIEGTVQRSGDRVRITAQLIYGPSDRHLWASNYERDMQDVFALEREVTEDIARQVQARLTTQNQPPPRQPQPVNPKALENYLQGNYHLWKAGRGSGDEERKQAAEHFQQAIDADPSFAPAYVGLANAHIELALGSSEDVAIRKRSLEKAVQLDPNYSDAHVWLGWVKWQPLLDWRGSEEEFRRAIALNPNNADAHDLLGLLLVTLGRTQEGLRECQIAQQLDPNQDHTSQTLYLARDYDGSINMLRMMLQRDPDNSLSHGILSQDYNRKGMYKEFILELVQSYSLLGYSEAALNIQHAFAASGYRGAIRQWAKELEHLQQTKQAYLPGNLATAYTILGDKDRAFYWLEQAYEGREMVSLDGGVFFLTAEPMLDPLRSDPRFKNLVRRVGLPQ